MQFSRLGLAQWERALEQPHARTNLAGAVEDVSRHLKG